MKRISSPIYLAFLLLTLPIMALAADIEEFFGSYEGNATVEINGEELRRDLSTTISPTKTGFRLQWTSATYKPDGRLKEKTYSIDFVPSQRDGIFSSAMQRNVFGKPVPLNPLEGEPFVWARIEGDSLSVFSLFINEVGEYEMQEFHRRLADGGLDLVFKRVHQGETEREIKAFLKRKD